MRNEFPSFVHASTETALGILCLALYYHFFYRVKSRHTSCLQINCHAVREVFHHGVVDTTWTNISSPFYKSTTSYFRWLTKESILRNARCGWSCHVLCWHFGGCGSMPLVNKSPNLLPKHLALWRVLWVFFWLVGPLNSSFPDCCKYHHSWVTLLTHSISWLCVLFVTLNVCMWVLEWFRWEWHDSTEQTSIEFDRLLLGWEPSRQLDTLILERV